MTKKWIKNKEKLREYENMVEHIYVGGKTNDEIGAIIRRWVLGIVGRGGDCMVILDYIKLLSSDGDANKAEWQIISERVNLLKEFKNISSFPMLLNTSFNLAGEPIIESPSDAIRTFLKSNIDFLVLENYIIKKDYCNEIS